MFETGVRRLAHVEAAAKREKALGVRGVSVRRADVRRADVRRVLALSVALSTLVGCSASDAGSVVSLSSVTQMFELEPVPGWTPPAWEVGDRADDGSTHGVTISDVSADPTGPADPAESPESLGNGDVLGLMGGRIRNDAIGFAARYVQLPMRNRFNERIEEMLWEAIGQTGGTFTPEVFPESAGLSDRGCVPGSLAWPATRVLTDPATGPAGAVGTAFTCEVLEAYGNILGVGVRVVSGNAAGAVAGEVADATEEGAPVDETAPAEDAAPVEEKAKIEVDRISNLYVNISDGSLHEAIPRWSAEAPAELWRAVVALLRRDAGGLSTADFAAPADEQIALALAALDRASDSGEGQLTLTIAPGVTSPELVALGEQPTEEPIVAQVSAELALGWASAEMESIHTDRSVPFAGLPAWNASLPVNCMLLACIAITYDDGPSPLTPGLLDTLWAQRAPATFFMLGKAAAAAPDTVARAAREGHEIGSHSVSHPELTKLPKVEARKQVLDAAHTITGITGVPVTSFRPPYGAVNADIIAAVGLPAILWSIDTNDWQQPGKAALLERSVGAARPGDIVLVHDTHADSVEVANDMIVGLRNRGFAMVTLTELFDGALPGGRVSSR